MFAAIGAYAALPDSCPRLRTLFFAAFRAAFGIVCAALAFSPLHPDADGTWALGDVAGFAAAAPVPWWARIIAGFFGIVGLGGATLSLWSLVRELVGGRPDDSAGAPG